jgi:hypothetical protein
VWRPATRASASISAGRRCVACAPQPSLDSGNSNGCIKVRSHVSVKRRKRTGRIAEADRSPLLCRSGWVRLPGGRVGGFRRGSHAQARRSEPTEP